MIDRFAEKDRKKQKRVTEEKGMILERFGRENQTLELMALKLLFGSFESFDFFLVFMKNKTKK